MQVLPAMPRVLCQAEARMQIATNYLQTELATMSRYDSGSATHEGYELGHGANFRRFQEGRQILVGYHRLGEEAWKLCAQI